jgi:hypothetical protein
MHTKHPCLVWKHYPTKTYEVVDVYIQVFLTSALVGGEWPVSRHVNFTAAGGGRTGILSIGRWMGPRTSLGDVVRRKTLPLLGPEILLPGRPARSQSLFRLSKTELVTNVSGTVSFSIFMGCPTRHDGDRECPQTSVPNCSSNLPTTGTLRASSSVSGVDRHAIIRMLLDSVPNALSVFTHA